MCPACEIHVLSVTALDSDISNSSYPHSTKWKSLGEFRMKEEIPETVLKTISGFFPLSRIRFLLLLFLLFIVLKTEV